MTEKEKELARLLVETKDFEKDEFIAIGLLCSSENAAGEMIEYLRENPDADFYELLKKAVELSDENNQ